MDHVGLFGINKVWRQSMEANTQPKRERSSCEVFLLADSATQRYLFLRNLKLRICIMTFSHLRDSMKNVALIDSN